MPLYQYKEVDGVTRVLEDGRDVGSLYYFGQTDSYHLHYQSINVDLDTASKQEAIAAIPNIVVQLLESRK